MECSSYILKCEHNGKQFICNRNASWIDRIVRIPQYVEWWEIPSEELFFKCIQDSHIEILEEIKDCSNEGLKDQKLLNHIKAKYQCMYPEANEKICDLIINESYRELKRRMKDGMEKYIRMSNTAKRYGNADRFLNEVIEKYVKLLYTPRYKFPPFEKSGIKSKYLYSFILCERDRIRRIYEKKLNQ